MSDLISRSVFNEKLLKIECESSDKNYRNGAADMLNVVFQLLNNQPIAYDVDKVVEQIDDYPHGYLNVETVTDLIAIIRKGGVNERLEM